MNSTKTSAMPQNQKMKTEKKKRTHTFHNFTAADKAQAVLAVWTERCKPAEVCRQMNIKWLTFQYWQSRAMEGMLQAPEARVNLAQGQALSPRLQNLLQKQQRTSSLTKLSARLEQLQNKVASKAEDAPKTA
jgi:transposase-like protein